MPATKSFLLTIDLHGFSALPGFKAPFNGDGQSALNPGTTVILFGLLLINPLKTLLNKRITLGKTAILYYQRTLLVAPSMRPSVLLLKLSVLSILNAGEPLLALHGLALGVIKLELLVR